MEEAEDLLDAMQRAGISTDIRAYNILLTGYSRYTSCSTSLLESIMAFVCCYKHVKAICEYAFCLAVSIGRVMRQPDKLDKSGRRACNKQ